jgi:hypothetical protein
VEPAALEIPFNDLAHMRAQVPVTRLEALLVTAQVLFEVLVEKPVKTGAFGVAWLVGAACFVDARPRRAECGGVVGAGATSKSLAQRVQE